MMAEVFTCQSCGSGFVVANSEGWLADDLMYCAACRPLSPKPLKPIRKRSAVREVPVPDIEIPRVTLSRSRSQWARFVSVFFREITKDHKSRKAFASAVIIVGCLGYAGFVLLPIAAPYLLPKTRYPVPDTPSYSPVRSDNSTVDYAREDERRQRQLQKQLDEIDPKTSPETAARTIELQRLRERQGK